MLDTVILTFPKYRYHILNKDKFMPSARYLDQPGYYSVTFVNNPTAQDKQQGKYLPRLTIRKRGRNGVFTADLRVEFSVPKLLYGNNLDEVCQSDFSEAVRKLKTILLYMGVMVTEEDLARASVSSFHPSKNIVLSGGYSVTFVIQELGKIQLTKRLDLTKVGFRNEGKALQYYSNSYSIVFYDKISDLNQPKGRAVDKDQTRHQLSLFDDLIASRQNLEILRMEVRLSKKQKMDALLKELGLRANPKFCDVFDTKVCQAILQYYWRNLVLSGNDYLSETSTKPISILRSLLKKNSTLTSKQLVYYMGLVLLCKEDGARELREVIEPQFSLRTWQRMKQDIDSMNGLLCVDGMKHGYFADVKTSLATMEQYRTQPKKTSLC